MVEEVHRRLPHGASGQHADLSKELLVAVEIYRFQMAHRRGITFRKLSKNLEEQGLMDRSEVSTTLDILFDQGMIRSEWSDRDADEQSTQLTVAGEALGFIKNVSERTLAGSTGE